MSEFLWEELFYSVKKYEKAMMLTIIDKRGSAPRGIGTSMVVLPDSSIYGTIGGGPVENELINDAVKFLNQEKSCILEKVFSGDIAVCGGRIKVLLQFFSERDSDFLDKILKKYNNGENIFIATDLKTFEKKLIEEKNVDRFNGEGYFVQTVKAHPELIVFGAGHIAVPLVSIAQLCDFNVSVFDDRDEFAKAERFPAAKRVVKCDFNNIMQDVKFTNNTFFVLVTREHAHDEILLKQILGKQYKYLGVIGSKNRIKTVKKKLIDAGFDKDEIERLHSPIGIKINSETPAEIAVSIAAELIKVKNE